MKRPLILLAIAGGLMTHAYGQTYPGQVPAGTILGNNSGSTAVFPTPLTGLQAEGVLQFLQSGAHAVQETVDTRFKKTYQASDWNVKCDGSTDDATNLNNAVTDVNGFGGGIILLPTGTCIVGAPVLMLSFVTLQGQGHTATIIQGKSGTTGPIIETTNFGSLTGTNSPTGPFKWGVRDLTVDGNKSGRAGGDNFDIYGYDFLLQNVDSRNAPGQGIYSEWSTSGTVPVAAGGDAMDAHMYNVRVFSSGNTGINWNGPHDSQWDSVESYINSGVGIAFGATANYSSVGTTINKIHTYGNANWGILVNSQIFGSNIESESNTANGGIQVNIPTAGSGGLIASSVIVFNNTGPGVQFNTGNNIVNGIWSHANTTHGVQVGGNNSTISSVLSAANGGDGLQVTNDQNSVTGIMSTSNTGNGITIGNGINQNKILGSSFNNTATQLVLNTLGLQNHIDINVVAGAHASWSGTVGANDVHIVSDKTDGISPWKDWQTFTPTPSCGTATFTVNSATSNTVGKTTTVEVDVTVSTLGTCASTLTFTLPNTANTNAALASLETTVPADALCLVGAASTTVTCVKATAFAANHRLVVSGVYRNQ